MEINPSTFVLEIINFLVLVWILKRFFYKPVLDVIGRRRAAVEEIMHHAEITKQEAESLKKLYEERASKWAEERQQARDELTQDLDAERLRQMTALRLRLEETQENERAAEAHRQATIARAAERAALLQAADFATRLLEQLRGPELETRMIDTSMRELSHLPEARVTDLRSSWARMPDAIVVESAYAIDEERRHRIEETLVALVGAHIPTHYEQNPALLCGVRVSIGAWVLSANLSDELRGFADVSLGPAGESP